MLKSVKNKLMSTQNKLKKRELQANEYARKAGKRAKSEEKCAIQAEKLVKIYKNSISMPITNPWQILKSLTIKSKQAII